MTVQFEAMLKVLGRSVFGTEYIPTEGTDVEKVCETAVKQGVFPLVYPVVSEKIPFSDTKYEMLFLKTIAINERKMYCLKQVTDNLGKENIPCCVLKGVSVASFYSMPNLRASGDIDMFVYPKDEKKAMRVLENMGMTVIPRAEESQHFEVYDKNGGLIEMHVTLYSKMLGDIVLKNKFSVTEPFVKTDTKNGYSVNSLGIQDNLNFLTAHLIKHFVKEGCGIRQVTDLLAFVNANKDKIDFEKYFSVLKEIKFDTFIKNVLGIGVKYFGLQMDTYETHFSDKILEDIETGGSFGFGEAERSGFYESFLKIRSDMSSDEFNEQLGKKRKQSIVKSVFLPKKGYLIKKGYTYLEKASLLYPVAYIHRMFDVLKKLVCRKRKISDLNYKEKSNEIIDSRMKLMEEMEII